MKVYWFWQNLTFREFFAKLSVDTFNFANNTFSLMLCHLLLQIRYIFFWKNILKIKWKYLIRISKSVVRLDWLVPSQIIEIFQIQNTIGCCTQLFSDKKTNLRFKNWWQCSGRIHIMWNPTIPQDEKFSTDSYFKTSRSMFKIWQMIRGSSSRKYNPTLQQAIAHGSLEEAEGNIFSNSSGE